MPKLVELLDMPGQSSLLTGFVLHVENVQPDDRALERAEEEGYEAKEKNILHFQPNKLQAKKINFDPQQFSLKELRGYEGAFVTVEIEIRAYSFVDKKTKEKRNGETANLLRFRKVYLDANGQEPAPPAK